MRTRTIIYEYSNVDTYVSASDEYFTLLDQSGAECWEDLDEGSCLPISYQGVPVKLEILMHLIMVLAELGNTYMVVSDKLLLFPFGWNSPTIY